MSVENIVKNVSEWAGDARSRLFNALPSQSIQDTGTTRGRAEAAIRAAVRNAKELSENVKMVELAIKNPELEQKNFESEFLRSR